MRLVRRLGIPEPRWLSVVVLQPLCVCMDAWCGVMAKRWHLGLPKGVEDDGGHGIHAGKGRVGNLGLTGGGSGARLAAR